MSGAPGEDIEAYNASQPAPARALCRLLAERIAAGLRGAEGKVWHGGPVWFLDGNPIVGYWVRKRHVQLLFWSGQSFDEPGLSPEGTFNMYFGVPSSRAPDSLRPSAALGETVLFKAAELRLTAVDQLSLTDLGRWLGKAKRIQWDYKHLVKRRGALEKIGDW